MLIQDHISIPYDRRDCDVFFDNMEGDTWPRSLVNASVSRGNFAINKRWIVPLVIPAPYIALYILARSDPGIITPQNVMNHIQVFPYDRVIFLPNVMCRTCNFIKPARSKHCNICNACVARHDHHCIPSEGITDVRYMDRQLRRLFEHASIPALFVRQYCPTGLLDVHTLAYFLVQSSQNSFGAEADYCISWFCIS